MTGERKTICLTGATGFIGGHLLRKFIKSNHTIRCITSDPDSLKTTLGEAVTAYPYSDASKACDGADVFIHLGARNNDQGGTREAYTEDNVTKTVDLARTAAQAGIAYFIFATTTHALKFETTSEYATSKQLAEKSLRDADFGDMRVGFLRLPAIYGAGARGNLSKLDGLPSFARSWAFSLIRSGTPIASVDTVVKSVIELVENNFQLLEHMSSDVVRTISLYNLFKFSVNAAFVLVCVLILPIQIFVGLLTLLTSKGGALFNQRRIGRRGEEFTCIKFRTMRIGTKQVGTHEVSAASVTPIGHFLRKSKLDELPQAVNIIKGEMSLIGPRPCLPNQTEVIESRKRQGVLGLAPGISGLAQTNNVDMSTPEKLALFDQRYLASQSILMDIKIIKDTVLGQGHGDLVNDGKNDK